VLDHLGEAGIGGKARTERIVSARAHSRTDLVLLSPANSKKRKEKETLARAGEPLSTNALIEKYPEPIPQINAAEIADRIYRLMQHDLRVEKDRTTRL
jgi:hypothetical protein